VSDLKTTTVYVTKYALTVSIEKVDNVKIENDMAISMKGFGGLICFHGEGREWHRTWESALARAEKMRVNKIRSLVIRMGKLEAIRFEPPK